jgi:hypothetical protein
MAIANNKDQEVHSGTTDGKLEGWKEIAMYAKRGIRTVQRWEDRGFPVRRQETRVASGIRSGQMPVIRI